MKRINLLLALTLAAVLIGCTDQQRAKSFGGTANIDLAPGQKFEHVAWEDDHLWIVTRPMHTNEVPETHTVKESSSFGIVQGEIVIREH